MKVFLIFRKHTGVFRDRAVSGNNTHTKHTHVGKKERAGRREKGKCDKTLVVNMGENIHIYVYTCKLCVLSSTFLHTETISI